MSQRYKLTLEYDGGPFVGWQRQPDGMSVQQALEEAVFKFCAEEVHVQAAGRTDAGVHARAQVAHCDIARPTRADTVRDAVNFYLRPHPIAVLNAEPVDGGFHARFSATLRRYRYRIVNRRAHLALDAGRAWHVIAALDVAAMAQAAEALKGHHDFSSFRAALCQAKSPVKTLERLDVSGDGENIYFDLAARSFLHNQVRIMVGTLKMVGEGKWRAENVAAALAARSRDAAGPTAPPQGLCLEEVRYDARPIGSGAGRDQGAAQGLDAVVEEEEDQTE